MLHLLGDNDNWAVRPSGDALKVWALVRAALRLKDEPLLEAVAGLYPEHVEAMQHSLKHWGLDWLRSCVTVGDVLESVLGDRDWGRERIEAAQVAARWREELAAEMPEPKVATS